MHLVDVIYKTNKMENTTCANHDNTDINKIFERKMCDDECYKKSIRDFVSKMGVKGYNYRVLVDKYIQRDELERTHIICLMELMYEIPTLISRLTYNIELLLQLDLKYLNEHNKYTVLRAISMQMIDDETINKMLEMLEKNISVINFDKAYRTLLEDFRMLNIESEPIHKWFINNKLNTDIHIDNITRLIILKGGYETYNMFVSFGFIFTQKQIEILEMYGKTQESSVTESFVDIIECVIGIGSYSEDNVLGYAIINCVFTDEPMNEVDKSMAMHYKLGRYENLEIIKKTKHTISFNHVIACIQGDRYSDDAFWKLRECINNYVPNENMNRIHRYKM